jgi:hypothetical protein
MMNLMKLIIFLIMNSYLLLYLYNLIINFLVYLTIKQVMTNLLMMNIYRYDELIVYLIISIILLVQYFTYSFKL